MKIFNLNPYRVLGIKANASAPEKQKVKNRIAAYIKVGKAPVLDFDLTPPLKELARNQELIGLKSNEILSEEPFEIEDNRNCSTNVLKSCGLSDSR